MAGELVGPIRRSIGLGCIPFSSGRPTTHRCYWNQNPDHIQDPVCICECHGVQHNPSDRHYLDLRRG